MNILNLDVIMHNLIIAKLGKGIVQEDNEFHWLNRDTRQEPYAEPSWHCLLCGGRVSNLGAGADDHAVQHIKDYKLVAFL